MKIAFWRDQDFRRELRINPEIFILSILLAASVTCGEMGALGYGQLWGLSTAIGALWVILFPRYLRDCSPSHIALKSGFIFMLGASIIFSDWIGAKFNAIMLIVAGENESMAITGWIWVIGGLTAASGLLGILLCKRLSLAIRSCSNIVIRACAVVILFAAILLIVRATLVGNELLRIGANSVEQSAAPNGGGWGVFRKLCSF